MIEINNENILVFTLRVILGLLFFFQGYDKVFKVKIPGVIAFFRSELGNIKVPDSVLKLSTYYTSYVEFLCGALLVAGLFTKYALYLLGLDLILVVGAFSLIKPMWDMQLLFPRLMLLSILLYLPEEWNMISADYILNYFFHIYQ
ncbi:MAG: DoxX family protein [Flavobacteriales bacterium]|nr:DoxX family protein [Flavobacteriales bacterium]